MKKLFAMLASLKLAVILLVLLLVGLSAGTIVETRMGAETAGRQVYYAWWFLGLQGLLAINLAMSIADLFPWAKKRIGFVATHAALLLILAGACTSYFLKIEGMMSIPEGGSASIIENRDKEQNLLSQHQLPFDVKLDKFILETYPGTRRPSGFRSEVEITDHVTGRTFPASIWMNHELHYRGFALFQSSYSQGGGAALTVLSVSKDPGQNLVFAGYIALLMGMIVVLSTRIAQSQGPRGAAGKALVALMLITGVTAARAETVPDLLRGMPVQHDGRVMPLDTLAREAVLDVTGASAWQGQDAVATFTAWLFNPPAAADAVVIKVGSTAFIQELGLPAGTNHASFNNLVQIPRLQQIIMAARQAEQGNIPRAGLLKDAEAMDKRLGVMQSILQQQLARPIPIPGNPRAEWSLPMGVSAESFSMLMSGPRPADWPGVDQMDTEVFYNHLHPVRMAWIILLASLALAIVAWRKENRLLDWVSFGVLVGGFAMMSWGILLRWNAGGRFPAANMYESMLFLAWGVGLFAIIAFALLRNRVVVVNAAGMAALAMLLVDLLPIDKFIHPVAPVLSGTPWLAIHVPIIMVSYSILALGLVVAHMQIGFTIFAPGRVELIDKMYDLLYWYIFVGSLFLIAGIITGSMWAASSWGRYWGWDPKEVWSLVAFLAYMAILHAKLDRLIGKFGVAAISIAAFQTILMTYLGVNFVLTTGMHSYGMGDTPVLMWMLLVAAAEVIFLAWGAVAYRRSLTA